MGGRGSYGNIYSVKNLSSVNDDVLMKRIDTLSSIMRENARYAVPKQPEPGDKEKLDKYRRAQQAWQQLNSEKNRRENEIAAQRRREDASKPKPKKTFVNSYGEATTRYITTSTYERAQARLRRDVEDVLGIRRKKRK